MDYFELPGKTLTWKTFARAAAGDDAISGLLQFLPRTDCEIGSRHTEKGIRITPRMEVSAPLYSALNPPEGNSSHVLPKLLFHSHFECKTELSRMFRPEDSGNRRNPDSNLRMANPATRQMQIDSLERMLSKTDMDIYQLHVKVDGSTAGGRHLYSSGRSYMATDQNMPAICRLCSDLHTFKYYLDQLLFTGVHPFLPGVAAGVFKICAVDRVQSHRTLPGAADEQFPDYGRLFSCRNHGCFFLTAESFSGCRPYGTMPWHKLLLRSAEIDESEMRRSAHDMKIYLDCHWFPELDTPFGRKMAETYRTVSVNLAQTTAMPLPDESFPALRKFQENDVTRLEFESAEALTMHDRQFALRHSGKLHIEDKLQEAEKSMAGSAPRRHRGNTSRRWRRTTIIRRTPGLCASVSLGKNGNLPGKTSSAALPQTGM